MPFTARSNRMRGDKPYTVACLRQSHRRSRMKGAIPPVRQVIRLGIGGEWVNGRLLREKSCLKSLDTAGACENIRATPACGRASDSGSPSS
jgi:hypothetical protein